MRPEDVDDFLVWAAVGVVLGGRVGYILFYDLARYLANPLDIFAVWQGGMSFHGGFAGVTLAMILFARSRGIGIWTMFDVISAGVPVGLGLVRLTNFINSELWGRPTDVPWAFVFPNGGPLPRHPSQLYEAALEGPRPVPRAQAAHPHLPEAEEPRTASREPSSPATACRASSSNSSASPTQQIGYLAGGWLTMGMVLSAPMVLFGLWAIWRARSQVAQSRGMNRLGEKIAGLIRAAGPISVADYMAICLFDPDDGYYTTREPFGAEGDFITAPEVSQMFGELVAVWLGRGVAGGRKALAGDDRRDRPRPRHADEGHGPHHRPDRTRTGC